MVTEVPATLAESVEFYRLMVNVPVGLAALLAILTPMASMVIAPGVNVEDRAVAPADVGHAAFVVSLFE
jgi:hypothetical protein